MCICIYSCEKSHSPAITGADVCFNNVHYSNFSKLSIIQQINWKANVEEDLHLFLKFLLVSTKCTHFDESDCLTSPWCEQRQCWSLVLMQVVELAFVFPVTTGLLQMEARTCFVEGQLQGELGQMLFPCQDSFGL